MSLQPTVLVPVVPLLDTGMAVPALIAGAGHGATFNGVSASGSSVATRT